MNGKNIGYSRVFQVGKAVRTDRAYYQYVSLGNLSEHACLVAPDACGAAGGAISIWLRIIDCPTYSGIITSTPHGYAAGFLLFCSNVGIE